MDNPIVPEKRIYEKRVCVGGIYQFLQLSTGKRYVGSSSNVEKRKNYHIRALTDQKHDNPHFSHAWNKNGKEDFVFSILEIVEDRSQLLVREQWYLDNLIQWGFDFNHCKVAGAPPVQSGKRKWIASKESRQKTSDALRGRKRSAETVEKMRNAVTGFRHGAEAKAKIGAASSSRKRSPETRAKMRAASLGRKPSAQCIETKTKPVLQIGKKSGDLLASFGSVADAARMAGVHSSAISACCRGESKSAGGFVWRFR